MSHADKLLVAIASHVESGHSNQMSLTVVVDGAVITGRLAPEGVWRQRVAEVLRDSERLGRFATIFTGGSPEAEATDGGKPPTHLHFHLARIIQGTTGIPESGGMYRVAIEDVTAWTIGDVRYSDG
ncbi:hypothetical protein C3489_27675 [Streptomyces sp. Ru71]|uniref:hypothetical protein n=1 Tax=Streptomyces sp. Ru71 TaxID=2080746 RepID=UPI000CDD487E|nr:hypothetical protein [Streptomyces sp. Ru71]POX48273.1 hypothetical protein C3489_27675 [Streptomyces sp. Ru71]